MKSYKRKFQSFQYVKGNTLYSEPKIGKKKKQYEKQISLTVMENEFPKSLAKKIAYVSTSGNLLLEFLLSREQDV